MELDGVEEHYHIRRLDNRYRVAISRRGSHMPAWYGYSSIEKLCTDHWEYVSGTVQSHSSHESALTRAKKLYAEWFPKDT